MRARDTTVRELLDDRTGGPGQIEQLDTADRLLQQCVGLDLLDLTEALCVQQEGSAHSGLSAVIGLRARAPAQASVTGGGRARGGAGRKR